MAPAASQLGLEGFDDLPRATDSLFFAIRPDAATAGRIEQLAQALRRMHGLKGRSLGAERFHVTLHALGDFVGLPPHVVAAARSAAQALRFPAFETTLDHVRSFQRPANRPLVLGGRGDGVAGVSALRDALAEALRKTVLAPRVKPVYTPHLTLLYDDRGIDDSPAEAVSWVAQEFLLLRSLLGRSRHEVVARWPLHAPAVQGLSTPFNDPLHRADRA